MWINDWIIQWIRIMHHLWWQLISLLVTVLAIKAPVIMRSVLWRSWWMLTNGGQLRWIDNLIIQWRRNRYHQWWQLVAIWVTVIVIQSPVITMISFLPTLVSPCSIFVATTNTLWMWHDEYNRSLRWRCLPVILIVNGNQNVGDNILARQINSC